MTLFFDGVSSYVDIGNPDVPSGTGAMTMTVFFTHRENSDARILSKADGEAVNNHYWKLGVNSSSKFQMRLTTSSGTTNLAGNTTIITDAQYFGAGVYTGSQMQIWLALAGTNDTEVFLDGQISQSGNVATNPGVPARIGDNPVGDRFFLGSIADVRIYDRALSPIELNDIALEKGQDAILDNLIYRWPLNEGSDGEAPVGPGSLKDHGESKFDGSPFGNLLYRDALPFVEKPLFY